MSKELEKYKGLTLWGLIAFVIDKYLIESIIMAIFLFPPIIFSLIYSQTKSEELQKKMLSMLFSIDSYIKLLYNSIGWLVSAVFVVIILIQRKYYKAEINRVSNEKKKLQEKLTKSKLKSSGHREK